jgi:hypothetical protein
MLGNLITGIQRFFKRDRCPTEQQLAEYVDQQAIGSERHLIERHLAHCDQCLRQVGFLAREVPQSGEAVPEELLSKAIALGKLRSIQTVVPWQWTTVATAGAAAVLAVLLWLPKPNRSTRAIADHPDSAQSPVISKSTESLLPKNGADAEMVRGSTGARDSKILSPIPGQRVDPRELTIHWQSSAGALIYELQVLSESGDILWEIRSHSTSTKLPSNVPLAKGKTYYVRLRVHSASGSIEQSKPVDFVAD